ncbi:MAG: serine/threonine-protein kinase [Ignavibacteriaceae bacterium]
MINERYVIKNKLGEGRSKVFLCNDIENPSEDIAIKFLPGKADGTEIENFQNEFITLRRLRHPNIVQAINFGRIVKAESPEKGIKTGSRFFTLEYFNGKPLLNYGDIKNEDALRKIITQLCSVLFYLHQSDYIYYDLKPENILVKKVDGEPFVKLIDLGLAEKTNSEKSELISNKYVRGTAKYIAPELLKKEEYDKRVDLYSLGIILYRIVYKKFPFETNDELKIYKAHLEKDFIFKKSDYSKELIDVIKRLLEKEPGRRYANSLEILSDLNVSIGNRLVKDWSPAKIFVNRKDVLNILDTYINDKSSSEIFSIKGFEGSGKTALSEEINFIFNNSVLIKYDKSKSGYRFLKYFLNKIIFNDFVFPNITEEVQQNIDHIFQNSSSELIDGLKGIFAKITRESNFILILDDFNSYDNFTFEMLKDILPILQVNKIKIIVMEDSDFDYISDSFHNVKEINLTPFTDVQVAELLNKSYNKFFPVEELKKIIMLYADLLPGSIEGFIKDCLQLNIFKFTPEKIAIDISEKTAKLLRSSHDQIYEVRLGNLSKNGTEAVKILTLFELNLDENILTELLKTDKDTISQIVEELRDNNILHSSNIETKLQFTSEGLKKHVYSKIENKKEYHLNAGKILKKKYRDFDRNELARQFELGEDYNTCYEILKEEIEEAEKKSALSYKKDILKYLDKMPLSESNKFMVELKLSKVLKNLNENNECLILTEELLKRASNKKYQLELSIQKGICLTALKEPNKGKVILLSILPEITEPQLKQLINYEIANAEFDLSNFSEAEKICYEIINDKISNSEMKAKAYNLMALIQIYRDNDLDNALKYFQKALYIYEKMHNKDNMVKTRINIGNILGNKGEHENAEKYFTKALEINISIGNLISEALINLNMGAINYYGNLNFEKTIYNYNRAYNIYLNLGDHNGQGMVLYNLAETYFIYCEYQKSLDSLGLLSKVLSKINNSEIQISSLFLLGKIYFIIGDIQKLDKIISECDLIKEIFSNDYKLKNYVAYLKQLSYLKKNNISDNFEHLKKIGNIFLKLEDVFDFAKTYLIIAENLISKNRLEEAGLILNDQNLKEKCSTRSLLEAERLYFLGKLLYKTKNILNEFPINLYKRSLNLIKDETIIELTWKVLLEISEYYLNRGNFTKSKDYIGYTKSVINLLAENIQNIELRKVYLSNDDRKKALEKLEHMEVQTAND